MSADGTSVLIGIGRLVTFDNVNAMAKGLATTLEKRYAPPRGCGSSARAARRQIHGSPGPGAGQRADRLRQSEVIAVAALPMFEVG